jgi:septal ring factor EnvC (AmiA/AmiB activator)
MMFERRKEREEDVERVRDDARRDLERERERLDAERAALEEEREKLDRLHEELEARREHLEEVEDQLEDLADELDDHEEELEDAESIKEVLGAVSQGIGGIVRGIQDVVYSPEQSKQLARSIVEFYNTLVDAGMETTVASTLTLKHMSNLQHTMHRTAHVRLPDFPHPPVPPEAEGRPGHQMHGPWPHSGDHAERET